MRRAVSIFLAIVCQLALFQGFCSVSLYYVSAGQIETPRITLSDSPFTYETPPPTREVSQVSLPIFFPHEVLFSRNMQEYPPLYVLSQGCEGGGYSLSARPLSIFMVLRL